MANTISTSNKLHRTYSPTKLADPTEEGASRSSWHRRNRGAKREFLLHANALDSR
jgi:hypothetical protein